MDDISNIYSYDGRTICFYHIDEHLARLDFEDIDTLDDILDYIKRPIYDEDENRNIYLARAIVRVMHMLLQCSEWKQSFLDGLPPDIETMRWLPDYCNAFQYMCSHLNIQCEIIDGCAKDFTTYRHETFPYNWCVFMSNDLWYVVDVEGILAATTYKETEGRVILEIEGETILEKQEQIEGELLTVFEEFWFCTKPNILMCYNFPDDTEWLLLDGYDHSETLEDFISAPFTYPAYHNLGLQLLSDYSSKLYAKYGRCTISLKADPFVLRSMCFPYTLSLVEGTGDISGIKAEDLPLLVRHAPGIDTLSFNIRFPVTGEYVFEVSVKDIDNNDISQRCFDVVIICNEADENCRKLPIDAGIVGFGYGYTAKEAGLKNPSKTGPTVNLYSQSDDGIIPSVLTFQIDHDLADELQYGSDIKGNSIDQAFSETHVDAEKGKLTVVANVKSEGEYALSLTAKARESSDEPETVLNYLLTTCVNKYDEEEEKNMKKRKVDLITEGKMKERYLKRAELTEKIDSLEQELMELRKQVSNMEDDFSANPMYQERNLNDRLYQSELDGKDDTNEIAITDDYFYKVVLTHSSVDDKESNLESLKGDTKHVSGLETSKSEYGMKLELYAEKNASDVNQDLRVEDDGYTCDSTLFTPDGKTDTETTNTTECKTTSAYMTDELQDGATLNPNEVGIEGDPSLNYATDTVEDGATLSPNEVGIEAEPSLNYATDIVEDGATLNPYEVEIEGDPSLNYATDTVEDGATLNPYEVEIEGEPSLNYATDSVENGATLNPGEVGIEGEPSLNYVTDTAEDGVPLKPNELDFEHDQYVKHVSEEYEGRTTLKLARVGKKGEPSFKYETEDGENLKTNQNWIEDEPALHDCAINDEPSVRNEEQNQDIRMDQKTLKETHVLRDIKIEKKTKICRLS